MRLGPSCQPRATRISSVFMLAPSWRASGGAADRPCPRRHAPAPRPVRRAASRNRARPRLRARSGHGRGRRSPATGKASRSSARKRRFIRLRTTALPIFLVTVTPNRSPRPPFGCASSTNPGRATRSAPIRGEEVGPLADGRYRHVRRYSGLIHRIKGRNDNGLPPGSPQGRTAARSCSRSCRGNSSEDERAQARSK